jgi:hypothetical protein
MIVNLFFVVSRDWQVRRDYKIGLELCRNIPNSQMYFISEELWTMGNASIEISRMSIKNFILVPIPSKTNVPIWLAPNRTIDIENQKITLSRVLSEVAERHGKPSLSILFYDGFGPTVDGIPSQIYSEWFVNSNSYHVFLQHGHVPKTISYLINILKVRLYRLTHRKSFQSTRVSHNRYLSLVMDKYSFFCSILSGSKIRNIKIVNNFNALMSASTGAEKRKTAIRDKDVVVFSPGSYKNNKVNESNEFEKLILSIKNDIPLGQSLWIKFKSGELSLMHSQSREYFRSLGVKFAAEDLRVIDLPTSTIVVSSCYSNVGLEALIADKLLLLYLLNDSLTNNLKKQYQKLGISFYQTGISPSEQALRAQSLHQGDWLITKKITTNIMARINVLM